jgi:hypothetical protein
MGLAAGRKEEQAQLTGARASGPLTRIHMRA